MASEKIPVPKFVDITSAAGIKFKHINGPVDRKDYLFEAKGGGVGIFDYDNDGWMDIFLVQGSTVERAKSGDSPLSKLYRNQRDGTFLDVTSEAGLAHNYWGMGVTFGDYDNDGHADIYATQLGPNLLFHNNGDGTFSDVTARAGVGDDRWGTSAAFGDYDLDGDLDLYVSNYLDYGVTSLPPLSEKCKYLGHLVMCGPRGLRGAADIFYQNNGDGTFSDVTTESKATDSDKLFGLGVVWADADNDGDPDLLVANDATPNLFFVNQGNGTFEEMGFLSGLAVNKNGSEQASMGVDVADYNNDGLMDVYLTHFASDYSSLYKNEGNLMFTDVTGQARILKEDWLSVGWGVRFVDLNHDGWKDLFHTGGHVYPFLINAGLKEEYRQPCNLYLNQKDGTFQDETGQGGEALLETTVSRGAAFGDIDNDGDIDILIANLNGAPQLLRNDRKDQNHWVMVKVLGTGSNRDGLGARITITAGSIRQIWEVKRSVGIYSASDPRAHFGLGETEKVDSLEVRWPSGKVQHFTNLEADKHYLIRESEEIQLERFQVK
jgi:hypothetical protein